MSVASGVIAIRPGEGEFAPILRRLEEEGAFVFSTPRLGDEFIVFHVIMLKEPVSGVPLIVPYNIGRVVSCKFADESGRKFAVRTNRMFESDVFEMEEALLVTLAEGVTSPRT